MWCVRTCVHVNSIYIYGQLINAFLKRTLIRHARTMTQRGTATLYVTIALAIIMAGVGVFFVVTNQTPAVTHSPLGWYMANDDSRRTLFKPSKAKHQMSQGGQDAMLMKEFFHNDSQAGSGFFVEFGARDGIVDSNTYFFEHALQWRGLLVEAIPSEQKHIGFDRPRAAAVNGGVCETDKSLEFAYAGHGTSGRLNEYDQQRAKLETFKTLMVPCFALSSLFDIFQVRHVSYMSVDTEGSELLALRGFPWGKVSIDVIGVEVITGTPDRKEKEGALYAFLASKGMKVFGEYQFAGDTKDVFFRPDASVRITRQVNDYVQFERARDDCVRFRRCLGNPRVN